MLPPSPSPIAELPATKEGVQDWLTAHLHVSRETLVSLEKLVALVLDEAGRQNLISAATVPDIWTRHVLDSAQVHLHATGDVWVDIGSGAGFPGLVNAALASRRHILVEPRRIRADFLRRATAELDLPVDVIQSNVERLTGVIPDVITARAVAPLSTLLATARHLAGPKTTWLLHKGRTALAEVEEARRRSSGTFEIIPSLAASDSFLVRITSANPAS